MDKHNGMKILAGIMIFVAFSMSLAAEDMSIGEIVTKFVTNSFLGDTFGDFDDVGGAIKDSVNNVIPLSDLENMYQKVKLTTNTLKALKAIGIPENIDIEAQFAILRKIAGISSNMKDFGKSIKEIAREAGSTEGLLAIGSDMDVNTMNFKDDSSTGESGGAFGFKNDKKLKIKHSEIGLGQILPLGAGGNEMGIKQGSLGMKVRELELDDRETYGDSMPDEVPGRVVLGVLEKFLNLIIDNMEFVSHVGDVVDSIEGFADIESKMSGYIDTRSDGFLEEYGITQSDIMNAKKIISGEISVEDPETFKTIVRAFNGSGNTMKTIDELVKISDMAEDMENMDAKEALDLLVKAVNIIPASASAVNDLVP